MEFPTLKRKKEKGWMAYLLIANLVILNTKVTGRKKTTGWAPLKKIDLDLKAALFWP